MVKTIQLTKGKVTLVDDIDYPSLAIHKWHAAQRESGLFYAARRERANGESKIILMHRQIMGATTTQFVDHGNRDGLDNRRDNLRICTRSQNQANRCAPKSNTTGFKGVTRHKDKFRAKLQFDGIDVHVGLFNTAELAHEAYMRAAVELFGEFARAS